MKNFMTILFCLLFSFSLAIPKELPFKAERMITDFHGAVYNGTNIICYGDYGIITYSTDYGSTWGQTNIGDKFSIKKIRNKGKELFGVTGFSLIKSIDNGLNWTNKELSPTPDIISMAMSDSKLFVLTKYAVLFSDLELNILSSEFVKLDSNTKYSQIESDNTNIYIISDSASILRINLKSKLMDTIKINSDVYCKDCKQLVKLKILDGKMYVLIESTLFPSGEKLLFPVNTLLKSEDKGTTWSKFSDSIKYTTCYNTFNNEIYFISPDPYLSTFKNVYSFLNPNGTITIKNENDTIERDITYDYEYDSFLFTEILKLNQDTLIAVGRNKLITLSYNGGETWQMKSYFNCFTNKNYALTYNPYYVDERTIFVPYHAKLYTPMGADLKLNGMYKTLDGGVTWLPQKKQRSIESYQQYIYHYLFRENGSGICLVPSNIGLPDNYSLITSDFGETYRAVQVKTKTYNWLVGSGLQGININDNSLFCINNSDKDNSYSNIIRFDKDFNLTDSLKLDSLYLFADLLESDNGNLYSFGIVRKGQTLKDSVIIFTDQRLVIMISTDTGKKWDTLVANVPFNKNVRNPFYYNNNLYIQKKKIDTSNIFYLYKYDLNTQTFDSLKFDDYFSRFNNNMFFYINKIFVISENSALYYNLDFESKSMDSVKPDELLYKWKNVESSSPKIGDDIVISGFGDENNTFMEIGKCNFFGSFSMVGLKINFVKLSYDSLTSVEKEIAVEKSKTFLFNNNPYPIPAKNYVRSQIFWNQEYNIEEAELTVYDIYGEKINSHKPYIDRIMGYNGILNWDCSNVPSGVYFIRISLGLENYTIRIIISK